MMFSKGSDLRAGENESGTMEDKQVMAGWRLVTKGTVNLGLGLYWPESTPILSLFAMEAR